MERYQERERERFRGENREERARREEPREEPRKRRKKKSHKVYAFFVLLLGCIIVGVAVFLLFYLQEIKVSGNEHMTEQEIMDVIRSDKYSVNTLYILGKYAAGKGEVPPCLEWMKVRMETPWRLKVIVEEKTIVGYIQNGDKYDYFDKEGLVIFESPKLIEGLPYIEGIEVGEIKLYQYLKSDDTRIFEQILEASREVTKYELTSAKIVGEGDEICLDIGNVRVRLGKSVSAEQIAQIPPILEKLGDRAGTLHLENYSEMNSTITFEAAENTAGEDQQTEQPQEQ